MTDKPDYLDLSEDGDAPIVDVVQDIDVSKYEVVPSEVDFEKRTVEEIDEISKEIDPAKVATEVLAWLTSHVENYIDNTYKTFKLNVVLDSEEGMQETTKLQNLYRAIPDSESDMDKIPASERDRVAEECTPCRRSLDVITAKAFELMQQQEDALQELFKRLSYYYEMKGIKDGNLLLQELRGCVAVINFEYEAFEVGVKILAPSEETLASNPGAAAGDLSDDQKVVLKQYTIPEGFTVWIELAFRPNERQVSLF